MFFCANRPLRSPIKKPPFGEPEGMPIKKPPFRIRFDLFNACLCMVDQELPKHPPNLPDNIVENQPKTTPPPPYPPSEPYADPQDLPRQEIAWHDTSHSNSRETNQRAHAHAQSLSRDGIPQQTDIMHRGMHGIRETRTAPQRWPVFERVGGAWLQSRLLSGNGWTRRRSDCCRTTATARHCHCEHQRIQLAVRRNPC